MRLLAFLVILLKWSADAVGLRTSVHRGQSYSISQKPCRASGLSGTCMFVWECLQSEGRHIGMCVDTFMFGSCCAPAGAAGPGYPDEDAVNGFAPPRKKPPPPYHHDFPHSANLTKPLSGTNSNRPQFVSKPHGVAVTTNTALTPSADIATTTNSVYSIRPGTNGNRPGFVSRPPHGTSGSAFWTKQPSTEAPLLPPPPAITGPTGAPTFQFQLFRITRQTHQAEGVCTQ